MIYDESEWPNKWVRVMCDYCAEPTWNSNGHPTPPDTLPISDDLIARLQAWFDEFNSQSPFDDDGSFDDKTDWIDGKQIALDLKKELPDWTIVYYTYPNGNEVIT